MGGSSRTEKGEAMRKANWVGVAVLVTAAGLVLGQSEGPRVERVTQFGLAPRGAVPGTLKGRIALATKLPEAEVGKVLDALGPAVKDLLGQGQEVVVPNLGTFRVVRIPHHRDLVNGRPATIGGENFVEFLSSEKFAAAANLPGVKPAETVPPFEYNPLPDQTPGLKTGNSKTPGTRTR
jgi:nucleoid DNA-binding protein